MKVLRMIDHPSIMKFVDFVDGEDNYFIVTELANGGTL